jgi:flavodoxin I
MQAKMVLYGSLTGNTQMAAMWLAEVLGGVEVFSMDEISINNLSKDGLIICGVSTWGEGDYNPATEDWITKLNGENWNLAGYKFALFGMGDVSYENFCGAIDKLAEVIKKLGGEVVGKIHKIDGFMDEEKEAELKKWAEEIIIK